MRRRFHHHGRPVVVPEYGALHEAVRGIAFMIILSPDRTTVPCAIAARARAGA